METPRRIFQTWKEKTVTKPVLKEWQDSWIKLNPTFEYVLWDDDDNRNFITTYFPEFLDIYNGYDREIKRADAIRYFYLYKIGGIYADLDFQCLKPFEDILSHMDKDGIEVMVGSLGQMDDTRYLLHDIPNAIMISRPNSDFWKFVIDALTAIGIQNDMSPELATGPCFLKTCLLYYCQKVNISTSIYKQDIFSNFTSNFSSKICITSPNVFYPINWGNKTHEEYRNIFISLEKAQQLFPASHAVTYWLHSW